MLSTEIKVGTLTANYNNGKFFKECLDGILSQKHKPAMSVIVDDGSTDDSLALIKTLLYGAGAKFISSDGSSTKEHYNVNIDGIEFVVLPMSINKGPAAARNVGLKYLKRAEMQAICVADSDDVLYPTKISKSIEIMLKYPQTALVYSDYDTFDMRTGKVHHEFKEPFNYERLFNECIVSNNSVFAANIIDQVGFYDEGLFGPEDYDMWLRIAENAAVYHIAEPLYMYRLSGNNITLTTPSSRFAQHVHRVHMKAMERQNGNVRQFQTNNN